MKTDSSLSCLSRLAGALTVYQKAAALTFGVALIAAQVGAQITNAFDQASDTAYDNMGAGDGWGTAVSAGSVNGGFGFGAWSIARTGNGGSFIAGNGPSGRSFDTWNNAGSGSTIATRNFNAAMIPGQSFTISLRFNGLNGGDTNRFALLDTSGNILFSYWHKGGDNANGWYSDANTVAGAAVNFPYAYQSFQTFKFTLNSATTYTFTDVSTGGSFTGTIANTPIAKFQLTRCNGSSAPSSGEDFQFDGFVLVSAAPPSFLISPVAGAMSVTTNTSITASITSGGALLNISSVTMKYDGNIVTPTVGGSSSVLNVSYTPTGLTYASTHTVQIIVQDNNTVSYTNAWSFSTGYGSLPVTLSGPFTTGGGVDLTIFTAAGEGWMGTNYNANSSQTLYTRYSMVFSNLNGETGGGGGFGGLQFLLGNTEKLIVGNAWTSLNWSLDAAGSQQDLTGSIPVVLGEWHTLVVKTVYVPGDNDNVTVYFDPDFTQTEANQSGIVYTLTADVSTDNIRLRCGNGTASATWTNIVVAPTPAGVGFAVAGPPMFQNLAPAAGALSVITNTTIGAQIILGGNPVSAISLTVDGTPVTVTSNTAAGIIAVSGQPASALSAGNIHNVELVVTDNTSTKYTNDWSFRTGFASLPAILPDVITGTYATNGATGITAFSSAGDAWLGTNYNNSSSRTLYTRYSMTFNDLNSEIGGGGGWGGLHFILGANEKLIVGNNNPSLNWSAEAAGTLFDLNIANSTLPVVFGEWHTIVVRTDYVPNANDSVTIYFDPDFTKTEAAQDAQNITRTNCDASFDVVRLRAGTGTASASWSNIVVASTSAGVGFVAPAEPTLQNYVPGQNTTSVSVNTPISVTALFGSYAINSNAVSMTLDGSHITPTFVVTASSITMNYQQPTPFAAGSSHTVTVSITDLGSQTVSNSWLFVVDAYPTLPVSIVGPITVTGGGVGTTIFSAQNGWLAGNTYLNTNYSGTLWTEFSMEFDSLNNETGNGGGFGGLHFYNGTSEKLLIGNNWVSLNWSYDAANWGSGDLSDSPIVLGEWHTFVVKTVYVAGGPDNISVWLDPNLSLTENGQFPAPTGILADASFDSIHLRAGNDSASATYSNIIITTVSPFAVNPVQAVLSINGGQLSWTSAGVLQQAQAVTGPWTDAANQSNPQALNATNAAMFYRLRQ